MIQQQRLWRTKTLYPFEKRRNTLPLFLNLSNSRGLELEGSSFFSFLTGFPIWLWGDQGVFALLFAFL